MLVDFSVENFGPFRDRATLSMQATSHKEHQDNVIKCEGINMNLLSSALIFGPNASGKSYLLRAATALKIMVEDTFPDDKEYPWYEPFGLDRNNMVSPVKFRIRFSEENVLYDYSLSFLRNRIVSESLVYYPMRRAKTVFERREYIEEFKGKNRKLLGLLTPTSTFLVLGAKYNDELCSKVRRMIKDLIILESQEIGLLPLTSCRSVEKDEGKKRMVIEGLKKADLGITGYEIVDFPINAEDAKRELPPAMYEELFPENVAAIKGSRIVIKHRYEGDPGGPAVEASFDMDTQESVGTRYMLGIMGPLVDGLVNGKTIMIDEFGSHLHPLLTRWLVEQFSKENNPKGAQLIATTHDVGLIDTRELLRRDQIFFTDKDRRSGQSSLYCLSDFKGTRKDDQILKAYLIGRYDGIPLVSSEGVIDVKKNRLPFPEYPRGNPRRFCDGGREIGEDLLRPSEQTGKEDKDKSIRSRRKRVESNTEELRRARENERYRSQT